MTGPRLSIIPARAATDRNLKPRDLQVLCVLGRHTDDLGWCRKSQVKMAEEMGCARSTVFEAVERLVKAGYLERHVQEEQNGRDSPHVYRVILDPIHPQVEAVKEAEDTCQKAAPPAGISAPPAGPEPAPPAGPGPAPKNDPLRTTDSERTERERASADEREGEDGNTRQAEGLTRRAEALFFRAFVAWDRFAVSPKKPMLAAWARLSWDQMQAAADAVPRFLAANRAKGVKQACAIATFLDLEERMWEGFGPEPDAAKPSVPRFEPPFGPAFAVAVWRDLVSGPKATPPPLKAWEEDMVRSGRIDRERLERDYRARYGWPAVNRMLELGVRRATSIEAGSLDHLKHLVEAVPVHTPIWEAWKREHELRGWPWAEAFGYGRVMFFPKGGPGGLEAFERAMREAEEKGGGDEHGNRSQAAE